MQNQISHIKYGSHLHREWNRAFLIAQSPAVPLTLDLERERILAAGDELLSLALHRVYRQHWDSKHKFPIRLKKLDRQAIEAFGDYWWQLLKLCERLHSEYGKNYENAADWFLCLVLEYRAARRGRSAISGNGKKNLARLIEERLSNLRQGINPEDPQIFPARWQLMQAAIHLAGNSDQFRRNHWQPFLNSYRSWKDDLKSNTSWYTIHQDASGKYWNQGLGRAKIPTFKNT